MGIDINGLITGFDTRRRGYRDEELKKAHAAEDREFSILQALATHIDPEIAAIGATALLNLAQGGGPKTKKGLRGFMGEVEGSAALEPIKTFLGAGATAPTPTPGSAAQPDTAVVEPERQQRGPGLAAPPMPAVGEGPPGMPLPGGEVSEQGPPALGGLSMGPPPPPPPETPQGRMRRLFPSAADVAEETTFRQLQGRLKAILQGITQAGGGREDVLNATLGAVGAPRRASRMTTIPAQYRTADGQTLEGVVIFDPETGTAEVDGQPVTILKQLPKTPPRPIGVNVAGPSGTVNRQFLDPMNPGAPPIAEVETGLQAPAGPAPFSGTVTTDEGVFRLPRGGGEGVRVGDAPARAGELSPEQQQATGWLADVNAELKGALSAFNQNRPPGMKATALPTTQQNTIVQRITKGRYKTIGELTAATKRVAAPAGPGADDPRSRANRVRQRLESSQPSRVQGSGMPPGP